MLYGIMKFIDRASELGRLMALSRRKTGGLAVVWGRRRIGKSRLLVEWVRATDGVYSVADTSSSEIQRRYFASAVAVRLPGFADVEYRDWSTLLTRLASEARAARWRGPIVIDELPYLVLAAPELPAVLQRWVDREMRDAGLVVALAGSSQRMMQGIVLSANSPLYGRAEELLAIGPLGAGYLPEALGRMSEVELVENYAAWGGVPRYWELAADARGDVRNRLDYLALDPMGPLHREPDRILFEEVPSAAEARPILDAIGSGAHRVSEIAGRIGKPATSLSRPLDRLVEMALVKREVPFGESERRTKRSLYRIVDPFFRLWFRVVAPNRGLLATSTSATRRALLEQYFDSLVALAWEDLCRSRVGRLGRPAALAKLGPWGPAARWWKGNEPEWDIVAASVDGARLLFGEVKWSRRPYTAMKLKRALTELTARKRPDLGEKYARAEEQRVLFVPHVAAGAKTAGRSPFVVTAKDLLR